MSTPAAFEAAIDRLNVKSERDMEVGVYLLHRLEELGVKSFFGVPGDFNLGFLDLVDDYPGIDWVGNCNELNAAYAADGYARIKTGSVGAVLTTYGVGELSAINGIAGAYAEIVPVVHVAGFPSLKEQKDKPLLHHTLGDGRYNIYAQAAELFVCSHIILNNHEMAAAEIDRVLSDCVLQSRPVYIALPTDIAYLKISSDRLGVPLPRLLVPNDTRSESAAIEEILKLAEEAQGDVAVLVDVGAVRYNAVQEVNSFLEKTGYTVYASPMGKSVVNEQYERYGGLYTGATTRPEIKDKIENAKLLISIGALKSDLNTGNFTNTLDVARTVELHHGITRVKFSEYPGVDMKYLLPKLTSAIASSFVKSQALTIQVPKWTSPLPQESDGIISQAWLWPRVGQFLRPKDVVIAETGTSAFGVLDIPFPEDAVFVSQILWGSIGWAVGSTLGAAMAARQKGLGRMILFIGDGSIQLTVQELSTMLVEGLKPIVFILNNGGYTIERAIRGENRKYNDVVNWRWLSLMKALGDVDGTKTKSYVTNTKAELDALLNGSAFSAADIMQVVEIRMRMFDAPYALKAGTPVGRNW
ncbi:thiamine diphosphate-binding protein [Lentinula aciculospora]|uniref:Thiamine diphosphate-binding protein n=1 Tax=Lentinula aciculospora TaxID=153920 RepID=A0A9W9DK61_9AGAR|nr:thiamine diphosphate-binding protein [Lentinula aciculospora]